MTIPMVAPLVGVYDDEKHVYSYAGRRLRSVTEVMAAAGLYDGVRGDDYALWRGVAVHRAIELHVKGTLDPTTVDARLVPALDAYLEFERHTGFKVIESEKPYFNAPLGVAGKPDLYGKFPNGAEALVELKSGDLSPRVGVQTAGQDVVIGGGVRRARFGLRVPVTGKAKVLPYRDANDYAVFMSCVTIANWMQATKTWRDR